MLLGGHTYSMKRPDYYACSIGTIHKCKAILRLDQAGRVIMHYAVHTHPRLNYAITDSGQLVRLRTPKTRVRKTAAQLQLSSPAQFCDTTLGVVSD